MTSRTLPVAPPPTATVSERLADHVVGTRLEDLPAAVVKKAKDLLAYHLGLAFAGRSIPEGRAAVDLACELSGGAGKSTIVAHRERATLLDAIFAHSELIAVLNATDAPQPQDDFHIGSKLTPGRASHAVGWIVGERERASGSELIVSIVVGYDVGVRLAEPLTMAGDYSRVPHKFAFAPFIAAAVAARLLGQDRARTAHSLARAAHVAMGVNHGAMAAAGTSMAARNGTMAAFMRPSDRTDDLRTIEAPQGLYAALFGGAPGRLDESLKLLGRRFAILDVGTKRWPMSASHYAPLERAHELLERTGLRANELTSLVATVPEELRGRFEFLESWIDGPSVTQVEVLRSLRVKLALLLVGGQIVPQPTLAQFRDPRVQEALAKVTLHFGPFPEDHARVELTTKDGRTMSAEGAFAATSKIDLAATLQRDGERFLSEQRLHSLEEQLAHLEEVRDVGEVLRCTIPDRHG